MAVVQPIRLEPAEETRGVVLPEDEQVKAVEFAPATPTKWESFLAHVAQHWLLWRISRARIDQNEKCKACGWKIGRIEFNHRLKKVVHYCLKCGAWWTEDPMLDPTQWLP